MANYENYLKQMMSGEISTKSKLNLRNESKQERKRGARLPFLKKEKNKTSKLLILTDLSLGFNPFSGEVEKDGYNSESKFRPELSFETVALSLKKFYNENEEIKEKFLEQMGISSWDTSNVGVITKEDLEVLDSAKKPRIFSFNMLSVVSKTLNGNERPATFRVDYSRNEIGDPIVPEGESYPKNLEISSFYNTIAMEKYNEWLEENQSAPDKVKDEKRREFLKENPISSDYPKNFMLMVELPLNGENGVSGLDKMTEEQIKDALVVTPRTDALNVTLNNIRSRFKSSRDVYANFYEVDMIVGNEEDNLQRGKNTKYNNAEVKLCDMEGWDSFKDKLEKVIDEFTNQEEIIRKTVARRVMDESTIEKVAVALAEDVPLESIEPWLKDQTVERYAPIISQIYGNAADDLLMTQEVGGLEESTVNEGEKELRAAAATLNELNGLDEVDIDEE